MAADSQLEYIAMSSLESLNFLFHQKKNRKIPKTLNALELFQLFVNQGTHCLSGSQVTQYV